MVQFVLSSYTARAIGVRINQHVVYLLYSWRVW